MKRCATGAGSRGDPRSRLDGSAGPSSGPEDRAHPARRQALDQPRARQLRSPTASLTASDGAADRISGIYKLIGKVSRRRKAVDGRDGGARQVGTSPNRADADDRQGQLPDLVTLVPPAPVMKLRHRRAGTGTTSSCRRAHQNHEGIPRSSSARIGTPPRPSSRSGQIICGWRWSSSTQLRHQGPHPADVGSLQGISPRTGVGARAPQAIRAVTVSSATALEVAAAERAQLHRRRDHRRRGSRQYIPAVEESASSSTKGLNGFPVVDLKVRLVDGAITPSTSSDAAKTAAQLGVRRRRPAQFGAAGTDPQGVDRHAVGGDGADQPDRLGSSRTARLTRHNARPGWEELGRRRGASAGGDGSSHRRDPVGDAGCGFYNESVFDNLAEVTGHVTQKKFCWRRRAITPPETDSIDEQRSAELIRRPFFASIPAFRLPRCGGH